MVDFEGDDKEENRRKGKTAVVGRPVVSGPSGNRSTIGLEEPLSIFPGEYWIYPLSERQILEDRGDRKIIVDDIGVKMEIGLEASIPLYLEWPVTDRETWESYKAERFNVKTPGRIPENLDDLIGSFMYVVPVVHFCIVSVVLQQGSNIEQPNRNHAYVFFPASIKERIWINEQYLHVTTSPACRTKACMDNTGMPCRFFRHDLTHNKVRP